MLRSTGTKQQCHGHEMKGLHPHKESAATGISMSGVS